MVCPFTDTPSQMHPCRHTWEIAIAIFFSFLYIYICFVCLFLMNLGMENTLLCLFGSLGFIWSSTLHHTKSLGMRARVCVHYICIWYVTCLNLQSQGCDKSYSYFRWKSSALLSGIFFWDDTMIKNEYPSYHPHIVFTYYGFWVFTNREWWQIEDEWFGHFLFVFLNVIAWAFSVRLLFHVHEFLTFYVLLI